MNKILQPQAIERVQSPDAGIFARQFKHSTLPFRNIGICLITCNCLTHCGDGQCEYSAMQHPLEVNKRVICDRQGYRRAVESSGVQESCRGLWGTAEDDEGLMDGMKK